MNRRCKTCQYYRKGLTDAERKKWDWSNEGRWATGMCYAKKDYTPVPHPVIAAGTGNCRYWEEKDMDQVSLEEVKP